MLCLFVPHIEATGFSLEDAGNWDWNNLKDIKVVFDSANSTSKIDYCYNSINNNFTVEENTIKEEVCGDMIFSPYLKLGGGNTINNDGIIESCYCLCFERSGNRIGEEMNYVKLEYDYVYL